MEEDRIQEFTNRFNKLMDDCGFEKAIAIDLDSDQKIHGPYFGCAPDSKFLFIGVSVRGENACPCCLQEENQDD